MESTEQPLDTAQQARQLLRRIVELGPELRNESAHTSFHHTATTATRNRIRDMYKELIFLDYDYSVAAEIEHALWRNIFYKQIKDHRVAIANLASELNRSPQQLQPPKLKAQLQNAVSLFRTFLCEASDFYHELLRKFQVSFGLNIDAEWPWTSESATSCLPRGAASYYRCLIYLGDIARYREKNSGRTRKDWSVAESYYLQASKLWPQNGNPHNQLAVLSTYNNDEIRAVYFYCRALAVALPFQTAESNMGLLFLKNMQKQGPLASFLDETNKFLHGDAPPTSRLRAPHVDENTSTPKLMEDFVLAFMRLHAILFTQSSLEDLSAINDMVCDLLTRLLSSHSFPAAEGNTATTVRSREAYMLRLLVIYVFAVHFTANPLAVDMYCVRSSPGAGAQGTRAHMSRALQVAFDFVTHVVKHITACCTSLDASLSADNLGTVCLFVDWLAAHCLLVPHGTAELAELETEEHERDPWSPFSCRPRRFIIPYFKTQNPFICRFGPKPT